MKSAALQITNHHFKARLLIGYAALLLGLLSLSLSSNAVAADPFFDESFGNYQEDLQTAKEDGKKGVFVFFHMEECPFCHRMRTTIMQEPDVIEKYRSNFLTYMHDIEGSNEVVGFNGDSMSAQDMAEKVFRVRATPVMIIFDLQGNPIVRYTGPTRTKEEFMWIADYVLDGSYKNQSFTAYKRDRKRAARQ
ncbi:thioredoxin fold domain-containing protein [Thiomicrorhabdus sp. 6S2-11]|uniref:Thioredoxin fold domain-containing protein n=1 Tax=Thiomicrorhabdus marina TaxID=2818442 RepID=A0ABS3Q1B8_9GAMM|nr:thioredoxin fold domain-containing protein [Thiomicrorhabdus marina]MBO1926099.1 thioredoxin fold domain-containing protein [Thiomicrorhabdus marina]